MPNTFLLGHFGIEEYLILFSRTGTATNYIKNLATGTIERLFITNSDNDSEMMPYKEENQSKENRPVNQSFHGNP